MQKKFMKFLNERVENDIKDTKQKPIYEMRKPTNVQSTKIN